MSRLASEELLKLRDQVAERALTGRGARRKVTSSSHAGLRGRKVRTSTLLFLSIMTYVLGTLGLQELELRRLDREYRSIQAQIEHYEAENRQLEGEIELLNTDSFLEKLAREELGLVREGEIPYIPIMKPGGLSE